jgi:hypothetical protein
MTITDNDLRKLRLSPWSVPMAVRHAAADEIEDLRAELLRLRAKVAAAREAWEAFQQSNTSDDHFAAVAKLDAALSEELP